MSAKLESKKFLAPTEFYAAPRTFTARTLILSSELDNLFLKQGYRRRLYEQRLLAGDYFLGNHDECTARIQLALPDSEVQCLLWVNKNVAADKIEVSVNAMLLQKYTPEVADHLQQPDRIVSKVFTGTPFKEVALVNGQAPLLAEYIGKDPLMQKTVTLGDVPPMCSNAIMAIEDNNFLEHGGVSYKGIFRALLKNITHGKTAQGGSTITQQLVKNYFLTSERTLKRKFNEFIMSLLLESRFSKDEILETYLNIIYMGQYGAFQIRGYGSAAQYYFNKELNSLNTEECALMAAIVNSPGMYNPFKKPANSKRRRQLVLDKMAELKFITKEEALKAGQQPLPSAPAALATETAPYYLDAVRKQLEQLQIPPEGMKIYTGLDLEAQQIAQDSLQSHLEKLETTNKHIMDLKSKGNSLEGIVLLADNKTGLVSVVVGGRNYRFTQFNRAIDGHRQIGSIMKPFVYLTALENSSPQGEPYTPTTLLKDEKFTTKYDRQSWSPDNYGNEYFGNVPMFFALKNSLNAATASLGLAVGLDKIVAVAKRMGMGSELKPLPAMTLGAFEMYPREVLQSYMTIASLGKKTPISFISKVVNANEQEVFTYSQAPEQVEDPAAVASLVSMMKQTLISGTARSVQQSGFLNPAAGKTGTTSDNKDAWFGGFTPYLTAIVWVGYDNNLSHRLTGANGPLPIWIDLMKKIATRYPSDDFAWPENIEKINLNEETLHSLNAIKGSADPKSVDLIIIKK